MSHEPDETMYVAGLNPRDSPEWPDWFTREEFRDGQEPARSLRETVRQLPRAVDTTVYWEHPETGALMETEKHNAIINPDEAAEIGAEQTQAVDLDAGDSDDDEPPAGDRALWHIPTDDYSIINPSQFLDPFCTAIEDHELGGSTFGKFELYRGGGNVRGDVYFDAQTIDLDHIDNEPVMLGVEVGWDFFGGTAAYAQGVGMDTGCINSMRRLTDKIDVRHRGDVDTRIDFWDDVLQKIDVVADRLTQMIVEAEDTTVDFRELPFDVQRFFEHLGYPEYLAERAAEDVQASATDPYEPTMWDLHSGATYAVTHYARGSGDSIQRYNRDANDLLMNPAQAVETVEQAHEREQAEAEGEITGGTGTAQLADLSGSLEEKRDQYEDREAEIKELFAEA